MNNNGPILECDNICKSYGENQVLRDVSFTVGAGEIVALVGENGAGKSTLMNILFGMPGIRETGGFQGRILLEGQEVHFRNSKDALEAGIGMVHQEFSLIPGFDGAENILLNRECLNPSILENIFGERMGTLNRSEMEKRALASLQRLGVKLDPKVKAYRMPVGHKQFLEIARELDRSKTRLLILDEPTAVLAESEAEILIAAIKKLAADGLGIVFISHRLQEVMDLCHKVVILRDGKKVAERPTSQTSIKEIASFMVQRADVAVGGHKASDAEMLERPTILEVKDLWVDMPGENVDNVNLTVKEGEIFGLAGLAGQGKLGVPAGIMGLKRSGGSIIFKGQPLPLNKPREALRRGLSFVSEDRRGVGLLLDESIVHNICFTAVEIKQAFLRTSFPLSFLKLLDYGKMAENAKIYIDALAIKCQSGKQKVGHLSGGNQQKVCLARAFTMKPELLLVSEPTRGIDVGAKELVLNSLRNYNQQFGTTVIITSSELEELRSVCHRIAVINEGAVSGVLPAAAPVEKFGLLMASSQQDLQEEAA